MRRILEIFLILIITSTVCYSQPYRHVKDIKEIPRGWICVGVSYTQEEIFGGGWRNIPLYQIEDGSKYPKGKQLMTCLLDNLDRTEWNVLDKINDCIYCYTGFKQGTTRYTYAGWTIKKVTDKPNSGSSGNFVNNQNQGGSNNTSITTTGYFLGLNTIADVKTAYVFIKSIAADASKDPTYLGEYNFFNYIPKSDINYCSENIFQKKVQINPGIYKIIAIEKTNSQTPLRFEKQIEIKADKCTFLNIDFNYSYLYYTAHLILGNEPKKILGNFVDISIDDGPWFNQSCQLNIEPPNTSLCKTNYPPTVLKPNITHKIKARYTFKNGEVKIISKDFILKENSCLTLDLDFN